MVARIYSPAKTAMQSGKAKTGFWVLQFEPESAGEIDPLMGYASSMDIKRQIKLEFATREEAVAYAVKNAIAYRVEPVHQPKRRAVSYADNFRFDRPQAWTH